MELSFDKSHTEENLMLTIQNQLFWQNA